MLGHMNSMSRKVLVPALAAFALSMATVASTFAAGTNWYPFRALNINHWEQKHLVYRCPSGQVVGDTSNPIGIPFTNTSSNGVSAALSGGGYGQASITVTFINGNWFGNQQVSLTLPCHTDPLIENLRGH